MKTYAQFFLVIYNTRFLSMLLSAGVKTFFLTNCFFNNVFSFQICIFKRFVICTFHFKNQQFLFSEGEKFGNSIQRRIN